MVHSADGDTDFFVIGARVLQGDPSYEYKFILCLDNLPRTSIDVIKKSLTLKKR